MSLVPGDRVAVFTGRDYVTIANHGVVLVPADESQARTVVFLPHLNAYCLADDEQIFRCQRSPADRVPFAEIVFEGCDGYFWYGTYQRFDEWQNTFRFVRSDEGFGYDLCAEIAKNGTGLGKCHLEIRIPAGTEIDTMRSLNLLRQILRLEFSKYVEPEPGD